MSSTVPEKDSLNFLYFDTKSPVAFTSPLALYREAKKRYPSLTFQQVKTWLQSKDTYTLHKPVRYNFPRNRVIVTGIDDQWQADLVDISSLARFNKGYKFLLTCIDVFSKFAWVVPLKNKSGETLVNGFQSILDLGRSPEKLQTDKGTEFLNRNFQSFLKEKNIHFFTTNSELKASVVERFNRTLKTRMWKYFTAKNTRVYIDILQDIVHAYNNSYHRSIGQAPSSVSLLNVGQVRRKLYGKSWTKPMRKFKFKLGDQVRISNIPPTTTSPLIMTTQPTATLPLTPTIPPTVPLPTVPLTKQLNTAVTNTKNTNTTNTSSITSTTGTNMTCTDLNTNTCTDTSTDLRSKT